MIDLGMIDVTPIPGPKDWAGYPPEVDEHPGTNHPAFVRELLQRGVALLGPKPNPGIIWDPQAGTGTTMREAHRLGLPVIAAGWDIMPKYRAMWSQDFRAMEFPRAHGFRASLVVTSPMFLGDHSSGDSPLQEANSKKHKSQAGRGMSGDLPDGHLSLARDQGHWIRLVRPVMSKTMDEMASGAILMWIVRDRIVEGRPAGFNELNRQLLQGAGFRILGFYWRPLGENHNAQLRAKKVEKHRRGQQYMFGEPPRPPTIDREIAIVAKVM